MGRAGGQNTVAAGRLAGEGERDKASVEHGLRSGLAAGRPRASNHGVDIRRPECNAAKSAFDRSWKLTGLHLAPYRISATAGGGFGPRGERQLTGGRVWVVAGLRLPPRGDGVSFLLFLLFCP